MLIDLEGSGLSEWTHPSTAAAADGGSQQRLSAAIIATRLNIMNKLHSTENRMEARKMERQLDDLYKTGILLASLLKSGMSG